MHLPRPEQLKEVIVHRMKKYWNVLAFFFTHKPAVMPVRRFVCLFGRLAYFRKLHVSGYVCTG